ncbi:MAG: hypothetical protein WA988_02380, partial [Candidatus Nanopelagicales bacterium]
RPFEFTQLITSERSDRGLSVVDASILFAFDQFLELAVVAALSPPSDKFVVIVRRERFRCERGQRLLAFGAALKLRLSGQVTALPFAFDQLLRFRIIM